jgi:hypothetical protein
VGVSVAAVVKVGVTVSLATVVQVGVAVTASNRGENRKCR